jgi:hypothetical protein
VVAAFENPPDVLQYPWFIINDKNCPATSFVSPGCHAGWL